MHNRTEIASSIEFKHYKHSVMPKLIELLKTPELLKNKAAKTNYFLSVTNRQMICDMRVPVDKLAKPETKDFFIEVVMQLIDNGEYNKYFRLLLDKGYKELVWSAPVNELLNAGYVTLQDFDIEKNIKPTENNLELSILETFFASCNYPEKELQIGCMKIVNVKQTVQTLLETARNYKNSRISQPYLSHLSKIKDAIAI